MPFAPTASSTQSTTAIPKLRYLSLHPSFRSLTHLADQRDRIFDIANLPFTAVPSEEMQMYTVDDEKVGYYAGYRPRSSWASIFLSQFVLPVHDAPEAESGL